MVRRDPSNPPSAKCTARKSGTKEPCRRWAIRGGKVCPSHGGSAKQVKAKAKETLEEWRQRRVQELDAGLDHVLTQDGQNLAVLIAAKPNLLGKVLDLTDRFKGGGDKVDVHVEGAVTIDDVRRAYKEARDAA